MEYMEYFAYLHYFTIVKKWSYDSNTEIASIRRVGVLAGFLSGDILEPRASAVTIRCHIVPHEFSLEKELEQEVSLENSSERLRMELW